MLSMEVSRLGDTPHCTMLITKGAPPAAVDSDAMRDAESTRDGGGWAEITD